MFFLFFSSYSCTFTCLHLKIPFPVFFLSENIGSFLLDTFVGCFFYKNIFNTLNSYKCTCIFQFKWRLLWGRHNLNSFTSLYEIERKRERYRQEETERERRTRKSYTYLYFSYNSNNEFQIVFNTFSSTYCVTQLNHHEQFLNLKKVKALGTSFNDTR